ETLAALNFRSADDYSAGDGAPVLATGGQSVSGLLKGTWDLGEDQTLRLSYQHWRSNIDDAPLAATGGGAVVPTFGLVDRLVNDRTIVASYENGFAGNPLFDLKVQLSYSDTTTVQDNHTDTSGGFVTCGPGNLAVVCDVEYGYRTLNLRAENRAELAGANWQSFLTYGVEFTRAERTAASAIGILGFHPEGTDRKVGLFAQGEFVLADRLTLIPGLRMDLVD